MKTKTYTIKVKTSEDGNESMERTNQGFSSLELLGVCNFISQEIMMQMAGKIEPTIVKRKVIKEKQNDNNL